MSILQNKTVLASYVYIKDNRLYVHLTDEREISVPLSWFPRLLHATDEQRKDWELIGKGVGIHWEAVDEDISVPGLLGLPDH